MSDELQDVIMVKVGEKEYPTFIDGNGVQRFVGNDLLKWIHLTRNVDLNILGIAFQHNLFSKQEYLEFYIGISTSLSHIMELDWFEDIEIVNPLDGGKDERANSHSL